MNLEKYEIIKGPGDFYYEFYSEGPKGRIKKIVRFTLLSEYEDDFYNLFLGDWLEAEDRVSDTSISDNKDTEKILATVASIVVHFTASNPQAVIFAQGSTPSRTRLYQMGITAHKLEIDKDFDIHGFRDDRWEGFQKNKRYEAFLLRRK
jgi:intein/homing endonuclease